MECSNSSESEASNGSCASIIGDVITEKNVKEEKVSIQKAIEEENHVKEQMKEKECSNSSAPLEASVSSNNSCASIIRDVITEEKVEGEKMPIQKAIEEENHVKEQMKEKECSNSSAPLEAKVNSNDSYASIIGDVITEEMVEAEKLSIQKAIEEENYLKEQMKEKAELEENCYKRLNLLLSRSSIYAQFMAEKIKRDEVKETKKQMRAEKQKENVSKKRKKVSEYSPRKKSTSVSIGDALRNANTESLKQNDELSNISEIKTNSQPALITGAVMHPYQVEGYEWLKTLFENGVNGILADEMGLGKTIQSIAFIAYLIEMGISGPFFVCGPLSTVPNWAAEFERFTPSIPTMIYHGNIEERKKLRTKIMKKVNNGSVSCYPVVITSYSMALNDSSFLSKYEWTLLVIDEAHRIKNFQCRLVAALKTFKTSHRMLLTGTPLQNDLTELWSLLNFILPEIFDDLKVFQSWFDITRLTQKGGTDEIVAKEQEKQIVSIIHQILTPFLLRRTKAEVALKLPEKKELIVHAPLTKLQSEYYTAVLNKTIESTVRGSLSSHTRGTYFDIPTVDLDAGRPKRNKDVDFSKIYRKLDHEFVDDFTEDDEEILNSMEVKCVDPNKEFHEKLADINLQTRNSTMLLRQICNHPYLVCHPHDPKTGGPKIDEELISSSGKLLVLDAMLAELKKRGHKILLFSQFVVMINLLMDYCEYRNYKYNLLTGRVNLKDRQEEIDDFNKSEDSFIFLISTKAGGLGLNLTAADTVIIYDSDWNPQGDLQAQDRCHRIGQERPVVVYRLIVPNTIDEYMLNRATAKRKLEKVIIKKGRFNSSNKQDKVSIQELLQLLQASDYNGFVKTNDNCVLSPDELNRILDRSDMKECV